MHSFAHLLFAGSGTTSNIRHGKHTQNLRGEWGEMLQNMAWTDFTECCMFFCTIVGEQNNKACELVRCLNS